MPNIHETIKQLAIEAGGPGSGRKPGFGFEKKKISKSLQTWQTYLKNPELAYGAVSIKGQPHIPVGGARKVGTTDLGDVSNKEEHQHIVDKLKGKKGFDNVQIVRLQDLPEYKGETKTYPAQKRYTVAWGDKAYIAQLKNKFATQDHLWLGKAFGYKHPMDTSVK